ncbi:hypothetical protein F2Q69_00015757 [Brassica cretica]|uniref:HMG box domain-containing protein n=1 Tax=Brassica cretica TaxID=69181 RepID=A0A8S9R7K7_BRACR|nr:hypothetical protein F2Q69_00015757 [Brassica cretica]
MSTDETLTDSQFQLVPAYGSSSDNMRAGRHSSSAEQSWVFGKSNGSHKEHYLTKEIGNNWRNLSPSDREVFQEKGAEDMERYKREMAVYKSFVDSFAAGSVAATDNAVAKAEAADEAEDEAEAGL